MKNGILLMAVVFVSATFFLACGELSSKQLAAGDGALKALHKIEAATQVGVNLMKYASLVIDAKAEINALLPILPDGNLKKELSAATEAYLDAARIWSAKINDELPFGMLSPNSTGLAKDLFLKYNFTPNLGIAVGADSAVQQLWTIGKTHLTKANKLFREQQ